VRERWARLPRWKWLAVAVLALYVLGAELHFDWGRVEVAVVIFTVVWVIGVAVALFRVIRQ